MHRRQVLRLLGGAGTVVVTVPFLDACSSTPATSTAPHTSPVPTDRVTPGSAGGPVATAGTPSTPTTSGAPFSGYGPLGEPDVNGLRLPEGFSSRVIGTTGTPVEGTDFVWHTNPDGGACFEVDGGGWIYVSNSESFDNTGGASMVGFLGDGSIEEARTILTGTNGNCAGGATPWGTWLSCEELDRGLVWECDPTGKKEAVARPAMGAFAHEAVAVDPDGKRLYLTEDQLDGALYRFTPTDWPDLSAGTLEILTGPETDPAWATVPDPSGDSGDTRTQVAGTTPFAGGEGITFHGGGVFFTTKYDGRIRRYDVGTGELTVVYDAAAADPLVLNGVDNVTATARGDLYVAEDGGAMQVVLVSGIGAAQMVEPVVQVVDNDGSEVTGPAFSPDGTRLYFSSQRPGRTYEVMGPWRTA